MPSKSQISVEYLMVMGFAALMTVPLMVVYYTYTADSTDAVAAGQSLQIARRIVDSAESVYYLGKPSQTTLKVNFPDKIDSINLSNREVVFNVKTRVGMAEIVQVSAVNLSGSLPTGQGLHVITITADDGFVNIKSN